RNEQKEITRQDVDAREAILELERRQADAESKQKREIETVRAREQAETARVVEEERLRAQSAFLKTEEQLGIQRENQGREVAVAQKNRERVIAVESERIEKDRLLEVIARERETQLTRIAADKEVEAEKREIAEVVRERVAVDRTVAEQEESIKKLRAVEEAERQRQAVIIAAEAEAQEKLVKDIKAAEAAEQAATHRAAEELTLAEARLKTADLDARAKLRLAEGVQAEAAAEGLAAVQVRDKEAEVIEKAGRAEAEATEARLRAEAEGAKAKALAEAAAVGEKLKAEAAGLTEKAAAMAALDEASRGHEEYRLRLEAEKDIRLAGLDVQRQVAEAQATVLATGLENADINIVGGESVFFDRLMSSIALGKSVDGFVQHSETAQALAKPWLDGTSSFTDDLSRVLGSVSTADVQNLTVSTLLMKLMKTGGADSGALEQLLSKAGELGLADTRLMALNGSAKG
ncbi:flotillin family protein, partial [Streptomyces atrovirens]